MHINVDWVRCEGNGVCSLEAPAVFEMTDDDELIVLDEDPGEDQRSAVEAAARACPKRAIAIG